MSLIAFAIAPHRALPRARPFPRHCAARLTLLTVLLIASHADPAGAAEPATATATPAPSKTGTATVSRAPSQPSTQPSTKTASQAGRSARITAAAKGKPATPRQQLKHEAEGLALATTTVATLSAAQLEVARRVLTGAADCEFNERITVAPMNGQPGHFHVGHKTQRYTMVPEETTTGAVRLVDRRAGVVWLQIPVKSMLMNSTQGRRLVDACTHAEQRAALAFAVAHAEIGTGIGIAPAATAATAATYAPAAMATVATATPTATVATLSAAPSAAATEPPAAPAAPAASSTAAAGSITTAIALSTAVATATTGAEPAAAPASAMVTAPPAAPPAPPR